MLFRRRLAHGERLFGLGDKAAPLDRRGRRYLLWNTDNPSYSLSYPGGVPAFIPNQCGLR